MIDDSELHFNVDCIIFKENKVKTLKMRGRLKAFRQQIRGEGVENAKQMFFQPF